MILLKNCSILKDNTELIENGFLGINNDTISYIGKEKPKGYDEEKDMKGALLIPGLINCHGHAAMVLLRGVGSGLPLQRWLEEAMWPIEDKMTAEDMAAGNALAQMEMLRTGTTCYADMYMFPETAVELCKTSGMKANIARPVVCFDENEGVAQSFRAKEGIELFESYHNSFNGRVKIELAIHGEYTCKPKLAEEYSALCFEKGARMQIHLSETEKEHRECKERYGKTPARWFYDMGAFKSSVTAAHCVFLEEEDMDILKECKVSAAHNPSSNLKLGSGFMPVKKLLNKGVNVCIGTDGAASNNNLNMIEEIHLAALIHNGYNKSATELLPKDIIKMAFENGAKAMGREDTGVLSVGKKADITAISMDEPHLYPFFDAISTLIYTAQGSDVCMTMVDGKILYDNGEYLTIDADKVKAQVKKAVERLYK
ncbi:MAG: amidohydrolase [Clostridia bacterium]|nr:amidohydrolase [Clostridia bacterium]